MEWFKELFGGDAHQKMATSIAIFFATTVVSVFIGRWWGWWKARREWANKHFMDRIIVSLNNFSDGYLKIRTIFERSLDSVFINSTAVDKLLAASKKTTMKNPIIPLPKEDRWFLLNFILNAVAEKFTSGLVRYDAGERLHAVKYLIFLTCEPVGPDRIRKIRAMMIQEMHLRNLSPEMPKLEQPWHADRMDTLRVAAEVYKKEPDNFLMLEVYV